MTNMLLSFPLPPASCSPNFKAAKVKERIAAGQRRSAYRKLCAGLAMLQVKKFCAAVPFAGPVRIEFEFAIGTMSANERAIEAIDPHYRPLDVGNAIAATKWATDALIDAGLICNDDAKHVPEVTGRISRGQSSNALLVRIFELEK